MPYGGRKASPRTSSIVQIIFYFLSLEIRGYILKISVILIGLDSYSRSSLFIISAFFDMIQSFNRNFRHIRYLGLW